MAKKIFKHVFQVVVLSEDENLLPQMNLRHVLDSIENGNDIGQENHVSTTEVHPDHVETELLRIGNDGHFFDDPE